jgi:MoxR-like ATPase
LSGGHLLIEGLPGSAKTHLARTFAQVIGGEFKRIQFTPDMLPADVTGFYLYSPDGASRFVSGPIFANVVLADELNRTTPRTQAALLEAMQEHQVTIEGERYPLPQPFILIASQLPYGAEGTYPLTEVQSDRFMFRVFSDYPTEEMELRIIENIDYFEAPDIKPAVSLEEITRLQEMAKKVYFSDKVREYLVNLVYQLRRDPDVVVGPSPRASIALYKGSRSRALLRGRDFVLPDDVKALLMPATIHRLRLKAEAEMDGIGPKQVIERAIEAIPVPKEE